MKEGEWSGANEDETRREVTTIQRRTPMKHLRRFLHYFGIHAKRRPFTVLVSLFTLFICYVLGCFMYFTNVSFHTPITPFPSLNFFPAVKWSPAVLPRNNNYPHITRLYQPLGQTSFFASRQISRLPTPAPQFQNGRGSAGTDPPGVIKQDVPCPFENGANWTGEGREPGEGRWYDYSTRNFTFYAYSAILDDRPSLLSPPVIRIIAATTKKEESSEADRMFYCRFVSAGGKIWYVQLLRDGPKAIGYGWPINREWLKEYIYACPLRNDSEVPLAVSIVKDVRIEGSVVLDEYRGSCMPVHLPEKPKIKQDFAICVQVVYENPNPYLIIEWLELQRMLGVTEVGVYVMDDVSHDVIKVFKSYEAEGFLTLRRSYTIARSYQQSMLHGSPVINDCMYRHIHRTRRVLVIDFDEAIIPRSASNLSQLIEQLDQYYNKTQGTSLANYVFGNQFFFTDLPPIPEESPLLTILRYRHRSAPSDYGYAVKSIIDPQSCLNMHNHYCWSVTPGYYSKSFAEVANSSFAINYHYKRCHLNETICEDAAKNYVLDRTLERFLPELRNRIREKIFKILNVTI